MNLAILTISDTRTLDTDTSGALLEERARAAGHRIVTREVVKDDRYLVRARLSAWIADAGVDAVITDGGTGVTGRDITPEAVRPLLDKEIEGFGEVFRWLSLKDVGTSTLQSRALGGVANGTLIFCLPGSTKACALAWDEILRPQLDAANKPCNFAELLPRLKER
jgi:molybdopterin adenylyltransferase